MKIVETPNWYGWGKLEDEVINAMKVIAAYCEKLRKTNKPCNYCPMFEVCTQIGPKDWRIPDFKENKE